MKYPMFSTTNAKIKLPHDTATPTLRCLLNGPFRDLHFTAGEHRVTPVHDVVFLDEVEPTVTPLNYRPMPTSPTAETTTTLTQTAVDTEATTISDSHLFLLFKLHEI